MLDSSWSEGVDSYSITAALTAEPNVGHVTHLYECASSLFTVIYTITAYRGFCMAPHKQTI